MATETHARELALVVRGLSPTDVRRSAARRCENALGCEWRFLHEEICPCMRSCGGRVRLYEGRFLAAPADADAA